MSIASCNINVNSSNDSISKDDMPCVLNLFRFSKISLLIFFVYFFNVFAVALGTFIFNVSFCLVFFCLVSFIGSSGIGSSGIGSSGIGSLRIGSLRIGSLRIGSLRIGSLRIGSSGIGFSILYFISSKGKVKIIDCSLIRSCGSLYSICRKSNMSFSVLNTTFVSFSCFTFVSFVWVDFFNNL